MNNFRSVNFKLILDVEICLVRFSVIIINLEVSKTKTVFEGSLKYIIMHTHIAFIFYSIHHTNISYKLSFFFKFIIFDKKRRYKI